MPFLEGATMEATHKQLISVCIGLKKYAQSARSREWLPDCSWGCRFFHVLSGTASMDWGVCWNRKAPRAGKLTFEHMEKCRYFAAVKQDKKSGA
jgi:hypothetical protein